MDVLFYNVGIHNYPPDIQEEYFKTHERIEVGYKSKGVIVAKSLGIWIRHTIKSGFISRECFFPALYLH